VQEARAAATVVATRLERQYPQENPGVGVNVVGLADDLVGDRRATLLALLGAVGLVLLIACANVGNLLLARASARRHELAVRAALGAARRQLASQIVAESVILSGAGVVCGVLAATWLVRLALLAAPDALPAIAHVETNLAVLAFASGAAVLTTLLIGLFPGLAAIRTPPQSHLAGSSRRVRGEGSRVQRKLVIAQIALTVILLVGAGLLLRSMTQLWVVDPGLNPAGVLTFRTGLSPQRSTDPVAIRAAFAELDRRLASLPGVTAAGLDIGSPPFSGGSSALGFWRADRPAPTKAAEQRSGIFHAVGPNHFTAMGITLLQGRAFSTFDDERGPRVMIVDEELARSTFPDGDAVGQHIRLGVIDGSWLIVGVARHVRHWGLDADDTALVRSQFYIPHAQLPDLIARLAAGAIGGVVRSSAPQGTVAQAIRDEVARFDGGQAIANVITMADAIEESLAGRRFAMAVLGAFAGVALLLAVVGTFGVMSFIAGRRTPEIGVRVAVGATPHDIIRLMLGEGVRIIGLGLLIGLPAAWVFARSLEGQLFRVNAGDAVTFSTVTGVLCVVIGASCLTVARRAAHIDPLAALRQE
jgi:predicted permease